MTVLTQMRWQCDIGGVSENVGADDSGIWKDAMTCTVFGCPSAPTWTTLPSTLAPADVNLGEQRIACRRDLTQLR